MAKKYLLFSMDDERAKNLSGILGNKTCKKIIDFLSEIKEASEKDIADALKLPINTVEYNLKKLLNSGIIEKTKNFFWSKKGKKISMYKVSNKSIIISPKSKVVSGIKNILPVALVSGIGGIIIRHFYMGAQQTANSLTRAGTQTLPEIAVASKDAEVFAESVAETAMETGAITAVQSPIFFWILGGILAGLLIYLIVRRFSK